MRFVLWLHITMYLMCGPRQLFFFQCDQEMPKGWTPLPTGWIIWVKRISCFPHNSHPTGQSQSLSTSRAHWDLWPSPKQTPARVIRDGVCDGTQNREAVLSVFQGSGDQSAGYTVPSCDRWLLTTAPSGGIRSWESAYWAQTWKYRAISNVKPFSWGSGGKHRAIFIPIQHIIILKGINLAHRSFFFSRS